ncbi:hypothetical protein K432DRAFT_344432 [Lepidopterella palustris CBS 459.81]|uniref:WHIM1 domain-containing protein n=1 Tax=Lepidopterella palustris CBS 459.81 TaxID=1314670 RepID=A0A8E2EIT7_9PEZI|nr:hypothetical protein K432DRAFT_344432 [Lepidopterella palustris CBS 459.81]
MSDTDSSTLSSPPSTDDEMAEATSAVKSKSLTKSTPKKNASILSFVESSPARKKRPASPPHEEVLADNPDIAFIVMFRSRFSEAFPSKLPHMGPQDIERGVVDPLPSTQVENLLCALLGLLLNRKKYVERGHYGRALEEAVQTYKPQWPRAWNGVNPLHGGRSFNTMSPQERLTLLKTLILWSLHGSEAISSIIKESYKQSRWDTDENQPLSVQVWGRDGDKRRYWLIEGKDDTAFRVYRESNPALKNNTWWSVAGSIEELRTLSSRLNEDGSQAARKLSERISNAIPRFEATEDKRKRREYRLQRKAQFSRPEPGFSLYEGRTRGKRMKYTFSDEDEDDDASDATSARRSARQSGRGTPAAPTGPIVTASGRHVRSRLGGLYGESLLSGQTTMERPSPATGEYERSEASEGPVPTHSRSTRARAKTANDWPNERKHIEGYNSIDEIDDEEDASTSGGEWEGGDEDDDVAAQMDVDEDEDEDNQSDEVEDDEVEEKTNRSLVITLRYRPGSNPCTDIQDEITVKPSTSIPSMTMSESMLNGSAGVASSTSFSVHLPVQAPQHVSKIVANGVPFHGAPVQAPAIAAPLSPADADAALKSQFPANISGIVTTSESIPQTYPSSILPPQKPTAASGWQ